MARSDHRLALILMIGILVLWLVMMAFLLRPQADRPLLVVFPPHWSDQQRFDTVIAVQGRFLDRTALGPVWAIDSGGDPAFADRLYGRGVWWILSELPFSPVLTGCSGPVVTVARSP